MKNYECVQKLKNSSEGNPLRYISSRVSHILYFPSVIYKKHSTHSSLSEEKPWNVMPDIAVSSSERRFLKNWQYKGITESS